MLRAIVWKEFKEVLGDRSLATSALSVLPLLGMLSAATAKHMPISVESLMFYLPPCLGILVGFSLSASFVKEKREGTVEALLCTPLTLRELWLGKVMGLTTVSHVVSTVSTLTLVGLKGYVISVEMAVYLIVVVPAVVASAIGLLGFLYYVLGMKEVKVLNYMVFLALFAMLRLAVKRLALSTALAWWGMGMMLALSLAILGITYYLVGGLSSERIITTIS